MPATTASPDQRPRTLQAVLDGQRPDGVPAGGAVDVQDVKPVAGGEADVGLGVASPPGQHPGPVGGGVLEAVGHQAAQGVLAGLAAARVPTRAARRRWCGDRWSVAGEGLDVAAVGEGVVQGQHRDAPGGIAERGLPQQQAGAAHGVRSEAGRRWRCRKLAALLRPQPSPLRPSSMASTGRGMAAAMAWATRLGWAWATLPPIDAAVPHMTSSHPYPAPLALRRERLTIRNMP